MTQYGYTTIGICPDYIMVVKSLRTSRATAHNLIYFANRFSAYIENLRLK